LKRQILQIDQHLAPDAGLQHPLQHHVFEVVEQRLAILKPGQVPTSA